MNFLSLKITNQIILVIQQLGKLRPRRKVGTRSRIKVIICLLKSLWPLDVHLSCVYPPGMLRPQQAWTPTTRPLYTQARLTDNRYTWIPFIQKLAFSFNSTFLYNSWALHKMHQRFKYDGLITFLCILKKEKMKGNSYLLKAKAVQYCTEKTLLFQIWSAKDVF